MIKISDRIQNDPEKSSRAKVGEHIPCGYSMSKIWTFYGVSRAGDCMKKFFESLREHAVKNYLWRKENDSINKETAGII